jgi:hypothetical protein
MPMWEGGRLRVELGGRRVGDCGLSLVDVGWVKKLSRGCMLVNSRAHVHTRLGATWCDVAAVWGVAVLSWESSL